MYVPPTALRAPEAASLWWRAKGLDQWFARCPAVQTLHGAQRQNPQSSQRLLVCQFANNYWPAFVNYLTLQTPSVPSRANEQLIAASSSLCSQLCKFARGCCCGAAQNTDALAQQRIGTPPLRAVGLRNAALQQRRAKHRRRAPATSTLQHRPGRKATGARHACAYSPSSHRCSAGR